MREFAQSFYKSKAWKQLRAYKYKEAGGICERCRAKGLYVPGEIVHHKVYIDANTIKDQTVTLDMRNLELLCRQCHAEEHARGNKRYKIDELGRVVL